jgi:predicted ABC-type ATPase
MKVIILSGVSGSGKSTWAKDKGVIFSADSFFMSFDGAYNFDPSKLQQAHEKCLRDFVEEARAMSPHDSPPPDCGDAPIIVDNTNTTVEEIAPYYAVAKAYGYEVELVTFHIDLGLAAERSRHGVSFNGIASQEARIKARKLPYFWEIKRTLMVWEGITNQGYWDQSAG